MSGKNGERPPTVSLCMIVKNEELNLPHCIKSIRDQVDEIIIVDTGSTDNTVELAKQFTPHVHFFKWNDSFSDARNYAISKASSDWIMSLDADDRFVSGDIRNYIANAPDDVVALLFNVETDMYMREIHTRQTLPSVRLFRRKKDIRFTGQVHEQVDLSKYTNKGGKIGNTEIRIEHTGYTSWEVVLQRTERNIRMLKAHFEKDPTNYNIQFQLGNTHSIIGEPEESKKYLLLAINNPKTIASIKASCLNILSGIYINEEKFDEAEKYLEQSLELANHQVTSRWMLASLLERKGQLTRVIHLLHELRQIALFGDFTVPGLRAAYDGNVDVQTVDNIINNLKKQIEERSIKPEVQAFAQ